MTKDAHEDLRELRTLRRYHQNPIIYFESVYKREPNAAAKSIYRLEECLLTSNILEAKAYSYC